MRKGDLKKQEILQTAETLFCRKGYEETSIQDILDILHSSKGSFYHHYPSKESLLEGMCEKRAQVLYEAVDAQITGELTPEESLNRLLTGIMPLSGEKLSFLLMLLPVFSLPEGRSVKTAYCDALAAAFRPAVIRELERGKAEGRLFFLSAEHLADQALLIVNGLWRGLCDRILLNERQAGGPADPSELLSLIDQARASLEKMLSLPFGSLDLVSLQEIRALSEQIHVRWK